MSPLDTKKNCQLDAVAGLGLRKQTNPDPARHVSIHTQ
jgi:hypothetical protein